MLTREQIAFFHEDGYLLVEGLLTKAEAAEMRRECHDLSERLSRYQNVDATWGSARQAVAQAVETKLLHCHDVQFFSAAFTRLIVDERLTGAAADLIGSPNVQLHHNKMFIKPPEMGSPFPMHQDYPYFPHERKSMIAATFFFDDAPVEKGCIRVVPGSHKLGRHPVRSEAADQAIPVEAPKGSLLVHHGALWHGSFGRMMPGLRIGMAYAFSRIFVTPLEAYRENVTKETLDRHPPRFASLLGQHVPTGSTEAGPDLEKVYNAAVRSPWD